VVFGFCGALVVGPVGLNGHFAGPVPAGAGARPTSNRLGPLLPDAEGIVDLPKGFTYKIISRTGDEMDDGLLVPARPDGMGAFPGPDGLTIIIRNHELLPYQVGAFGEDDSRYRVAESDKFYDTGDGKHPMPGGTTTVLFDTRTQTVKSEFLSLAGTVQNCAGGKTPWNTWISCEETEQKSDKTEKFTTAKNHGYNFEVPATAEMGLADPVPLKAMGRFYHEAVCVDPKTGIVYQTEDLDDGLIYRFIPDQPGRLQEGGKLQALAIAEKPGTDTRNWTRRERPIPEGKKMAVEWIDLEDIDSPDNDLRYRGFRAGAARFAGGEGMCLAGGAVFVACTKGGRKRIGQIWRYVPSPFEGTAREHEVPGILELFAEPNNPRLMTAADNLTTAPWGDVVLCEDHKSGKVHLVCMTLNGEFYPIARHQLAGEFAGATFSPDGTTLFVNIQDAGLTFAITGPWPQAAAADAGDGHGVDDDPGADSM
jgi:secreted PhoX family phosphatase